MASAVRSAYSTIGVRNLSSALQGHPYGVRGETPTLQGDAVNRWTSYPPLCWGGQANGRFLSFT
jgi:hypothetical protein